MNKRRPILGALAVVALVVVYRIFAVGTVRSGECNPHPIDPNLRRVTRDENGQPVTYPARIDFPAENRPLVVMTYNISGHSALTNKDHIREIAAVINKVKPDIVGLEEVHRKTWQSRFDDQAAQLIQLTGMHGWFGRSYGSFEGGEFGNMLLTRGDIVSAEVHELPSVGERRSIIESVVRIDGATLNVYVTHLTTWGKFNRKSRGVQLACVARYVRSSRYPYLLVGDFNAPPTSPEVQAFRRENAAQMCGENIGISHPLMKERIDYVWADYGWQLQRGLIVKAGPSDHYPVVAEVWWTRRN